MSEAGVAGHICWPSIEGCGCALLPVARIEGEAVTDPGRGGGPIRASDSGSGDIDSASEMSLLDGIKPAEVGRDEPPDWCACCSNSSLTSLGGITEDKVPFFLWPWLCGFTMGDCLMRAEDPEDRVDAALLLFFNFLFKSCCCACSPSISTSRSIGDVVNEFSAVCVCEK